MNGALGGVDIEQIYIAREFLMAKWLVWVVAIGVAVAVVDVGALLKPSSDSGSGSGWR
jgi:hypothetical protein